MSPQDDLAEIFIAQGRYDEAIAMCQEVLDEVPSWPTKQLLAKAIALKGQAAKQTQLSSGP
jgi:cytochrome c-type biogenesis protein CcmH/NrfG